MRPKCATGDAHCLHGLCLPAHHSMRGCPAGVSCGCVLRVCPAVARKTCGCVLRVCPAVARKTCGCALRVQELARKSNFVPVTEERAAEPEETRGEALSPEEAAQQQQGTGGGQGRQAEEEAWHRGFFIKKVGRGLCRKRCPHARIVLRQEGGQRLVQREVPMCARCSLSRRWAEACAECSAHMSALCRVT